MRILITGGAGFIGSNAARAFLQAGHAVTIIDDLSLGTKENVPQEATCIIGDVRKPGILEQAEPSEIILHLAASSSAPMFSEHLTEAVQNNIEGHLAVLEHARKTGARKVLFASTSSVYGNNPLPLQEEQPVVPPNYYAASKLAQEHLSRIFSVEHNLPIIAFRFMSVYGPREEHKGRFANLVSQFVWGMEVGRSPVLYGDGTQTRDFTSVTDLIQAFMKAIPYTGTDQFQVFNIGTGTSVSLNELVATINRVLKTTVQPTYIENPIKRAYINDQLADLTKITQELSYQPTVSLEEGVREIVEFRKQHPVAPRDMSY